MNLSPSHNTLALAILALLLAHSMLENSRHKVWTSHTRFQASVDLLRTEIKVFLANALDFSRKEQVQEALEHGELIHYSNIGKSLHRAEDQLNPRVKLAVLQAVEGLAEHQVTGDVKSGEVHPTLDIDDGYPLPNLRPQFGDQGIDIPCDKAFLISQSLLREGMG